MILNFFFIWLAIVILFGIFGLALCKAAARGDRMIDESK